MGQFNEGKNCFGTFGDAGESNGRMTVTRYSYNFETKRCEAFIYKGKGGDLSNNFRFESDCNLECNNFNNYNMKEKPSQLLMDAISEFNKANNDESEESDNFFEITARSGGAFSPMRIVPQANKNMGGVNLGMGYISKDQYFENVNYIRAVVNRCGKPIDKGSSNCKRTAFHKRYAYKPGDTEGSCHAFPWSGCFDLDDGKVTESEANFNSFKDSPSCNIYCLQYNDFKQFLDENPNAQASKKNPFDNGMFGQIPSITGRNAGNMGIFSDDDDSDTARSFGAPKEQPKQLFEKVTNSITFTQRANAPKNPYQLAKNPARCNNPLPERTCNTKFRRYTYDADKDECVQIIFGLCTRASFKDNLFLSLNLCKEICVKRSKFDMHMENIAAAATSNMVNDDIGNVDEEEEIESRVLTTVIKLQPAMCELPKHLGSCSSVIPRFYYDKATDSCKRMIYSGCGGNKNRFATETACQDACVSGVSDKEDEDNISKPGYGQCMSEQTPDNYVKADTDTESFYCSSVLSRFVFDSDSKSCKAITYTGCGRTRNFFKDEEHCKRVCAAFLN